MNAPILADKQGTPARPTRGLLDTALDSQNKDRRLAIVGAWLAFMIGLAADGTVDSPASFGVAGTVGAVIVALGFAAASRCRLLPQRSHKHRVRLVFLSIAVGGAVGLINLAANWAITEADPALRALLVERIMAEGAVGGAGHRADDGGGGVPPLCHERDGLACVPQRRNARGSHLRLC